MSKQLLDVIILLTTIISGGISALSKQIASAYPKIA